MGGRVCVFTTKRMVASGTAQSGPLRVTTSTCVRWAQPQRLSYQRTLTTKKTRRDITNEDVSRALKVAATLLDYPRAQGIPVDCIDTHSLQSGGANALSLAGYSDTQIQKMGRWRGALLKEYIREELAGFSAGMSRSMKQRFNFVNIAVNAFNFITDDLLAQEYEINVSTTAAA